MNCLEDLERRIRERGVRVEERLALLRILAAGDGDKQIAARQQELLDRVRKMAAALKQELG